MWKYHEWDTDGTIASTSESGGITLNALKVHENFEKVYDFYNSIGVKSFDRQGKEIKVTVGYNSLNDNAYWSSDKAHFVFGTGNLEAALDVTGHEFTHAVINYIVGGRSLSTTLTYDGETGALNESYADIMGGIIEGKTGADRWNHGEDSGSIGRNLSAPSSINITGNISYPEHYSAVSDPQWIDPNTGWLNRFDSRDNGGVHIFSSIFNFASYKMMVDPRTSNVTATMWGNVFYRSLYRLTTSSQVSVGCRDGLTRKIPGSK